jgi:hypothetical protein
MEHLTADRASTPELAAARQSAELDHALARAIKRLIAEARGGDDSDDKD